MLLGRLNPLKTVKNRLSASVSGQIRRFPPPSAPPAGAAAGRGNRGDSVPTEKMGTRNG